jgi:hypothetical protein
LLKKEAVVAPPGFSKSGATLTRTLMEDPQDNERVAGLLRERPKLQLQQRTLPVDNQPVETISGLNTPEELGRQQRRAEERARKEKERKDREQRVLQSAFASDDEASVSSDNYRGAW